MKNQWFAFCILVSLAFVVPAAAQSNPSPDEIAGRIEAYLKPLLEEDLLSGSILVARGDQILFSRGFGPANREYDAPCTPTTKHRLASMSKQFTAAAILLLEEKGLLKVTETLDRFLPSFPNAGKITLHHLLSHTAGVVNYSSLPDTYKNWTNALTIDEVIALFQDKPLRFEPGTKYEYSNSNYVLLSRIIEIVSKKGYEEYLKENIFLPLGMTDTGVDDPLKILRERATGHYKEETGIIQAPYLYVPFTSGAGALVSTVGDLFKWNRALTTGRILSPESRKKMFTANLDNYGYGWFIRKELGRNLVEHRGGLNGFLTMTQRFIDDDVVVISLFNFVTMFAREVNLGLASIALGLEPEPVLIPAGIAVPEETLRRWEGIYQMTDGPEYRLAVENGKLIFTPHGRDPREAIPQKENRFYVRAEAVMINFRTDKDGAVTMILQQSERGFPCPRKRN